MTRCFISLESSHHLPLMAGDGGEGGQVRGLPYGDRCFETLLESVRKQKRGACTCAHAHTSHTCAHTPHNYTRAHAHTHFNMSDDPKWMRGGPGCQLVCSHLL